MIRIQYFIILGIALACFSSAHANEKPQGGMYYLYIKKEEEPAPAQEQKTEEKETPESKVWKKYRALAAGTPEPEEDKAETQPEQEDALPKIEGEKAVEEKTAPPPAKPTGMAAIIDEYRNNRTQRRQMHNLTITPAPEKKPDDQSSE